MWQHHVDLLAYHDLGGRSGFKLALQEAGGRFVLYVAGFWHPGWSILDVTDPGTLGCSGSSTARPAR